MCEGHSSNPPANAVGKHRHLKDFTSTWGQWGGAKTHKNPTQTNKTGCWERRYISRVAPEDTTTPSSSNFSHFIGQTLTQKLFADSPWLPKQPSYIQAVNLSYKSLVLWHSWVCNFITKSTNKGPPATFIPTFFWRFSSLKGQREKKYLEFYQLKCNSEKT